MNNFRKGLFMLFMAAFGIQAEAQTTGAEAKAKNVTQVEANCEDIVGSIDRALATATDSKSNVIVLVRAERNPLNSINLARAKGLRNYFVHRGFTNFEVGIDFLANTDSRVDIYVAGRKLDSLRIGRKYELDLSPCVFGVDPK